MYISCRYLATGDSFTTIAFSYRVGIATVSTIVEEVCDVIMLNLVNFPENFSCLSGTDA